jgi:hypothetical protein
MRANSHYKLTKAILEQIDWPEPMENGVLAGARDADTILQYITLGHYFDGKKGEGAALNNIIKQLKDDSPTAMGVCCHIAQDVCLPVHSNVLLPWDHLLWEGFIDKHIDGIIGDLYFAEGIESAPDLMEIFRKLSKSSLSKLDIMRRHWSSDKNTFLKDITGCIQEGTGASISILTNWDQLSRNVV